MEFSQSSYRQPLDLTQTLGVIDKALFLRHEGYLGAIGAFLKGAEQDSECSPAMGPGPCPAMPEGEVSGRL